MAQMGSMSDDPHGLDAPNYAAFAWARYRRLLGWMALATALIVAIAVWLLDLWYGPLSWIAILAAIGGFGATYLGITSAAGVPEAAAFTRRLRRRRSRP